MHNIDIQNNVWLNLQSFLQHYCIKTRGFQSIFWYEHFVGEAAAGPAGCRFNMLSKRGNFKRQKTAEANKYPSEGLFLYPVVQTRCLESSFAVRGAELNFYSSVWSPESCKQGARSLADLIMRLSAFLPRRTSRRYQLLCCKCERSPKHQLCLLSQTTNFCKHTRACTHTQKKSVYTRRYRCIIADPQLLALAATPTGISKKTKKKTMKTNKTETRLCAPAARPPARRSQT